MSTRLNRRGESWEQTVERVKAMYPALRPDEHRWMWDLNDNQVVDVLGRIIAYAVRHERYGGTPAPLSSLDWEVDGEAVVHEIRAILGHEYTNLPFREALRSLAGSRSLVHLSRKTGLDKYRLHRLLSGRYAPSGAEMEAVAVAFNKDPRYFLEYRSTMVAAAVLRLMDEEPDQSAAVARRLPLPSGSGTQ